MAPETVNECNIEIENFRGISLLCEALIICEYILENKFPQILELWIQTILNKIICRRLQTFTTHIDCKANTEDINSEILRKIIERIEVSGN